MQDIRHGRGCTLVDPHGDLVQRVYDAIPENRKDDVIYFDVTDPNIEWGYNPFRRIAYNKRPLLTAGMISMFKHLFADAWGARIEHILRYSILTLLDQPRANLSSLLYLLTDKYFRKTMIQHIVSPEVRNFILRELPRYSPDALAPVLNKVGTFLAYPNIRKILIENTKQISFRKVMDGNKIFLMNLSKGVVGEDVSHIIGSTMITTLSLAAFSRANIPEETRVPHFVYIDEFQNFTGSDFASMLSELRKFKVGLVIAHQYLDQLDVDVRNSIMGNVGTLISFRLGARDALFVSKEFYPKFHVEDLMNLANYSIYLKMMVGGRVRKPFSGKTSKLI